VSTRRCRMITSILLTVSLLLAGCATPATSPPAPPELPKGPEAEWNLVVIGDSSLWELAKAFASQIEADVGVKVVYNDSTVGGLSAGMVLQALQTGESSNRRLAALPDALRDAEVVVMFVNPLDSVDPDATNEAVLSASFSNRPRYRALGYRVARVPLFSPQERLTSWVWEQAEVPISGVCST
jgi:hypothetical protein